MKSHVVLIVTLAASVQAGLAAPLELPASWAYPVSAANPNAPGFKVRIAQADPVQVGFVRLEAASARAEAQLAGALIDPNTRQPFPDVSDKSGFNPDGTYDEAVFIDYEEAGNATALIPGIPDGAVGDDDFALEAVTFLHLTPGTYSMIVNSDDGFRVSAGRDARDWFRRFVVGEAEGPRGAEDTTFEFTVTQEGLYSFRLLWYEAGGGANVSWFSGQNRILINDTASGGIKAYRAITEPRPSFIRYVSPAPNSVGVSRSATIQCQIGDGDAAPVDPSSVELFLNDVKVAPAIDKSGSVTKVSYTPSTLLPALSTNKVRLVYRDTSAPPTPRTEEFTFRTIQFASINLPAPIYFENFDATPEGSLPAGWTEISYNDQSASSPDVDFGNLDSAAYAKWTVVNVDRFKGSFVTYSNPDNDPSWENDYKRVLAFNPANIVNDQVVQELATGRFLFGNSGYRNDPSQVLILFTRDFDLSGKRDVYLSFHSLWEQNQDSMATVEYSIDGGQTWLPILYMLEPADVVRDQAEQVDAVATLTAEHNDVARYIDPTTGEEKGGTYGAFPGAEISPDLAPFISARAQDDSVNSKRVELFRLEKADNQARVRFRFAHAGTDSWYFGVDNFGLYSIPATSSLTVSASRQGENIVLSWQGTPGVVLQMAASLINPVWAEVPGTAGASTATEPMTGAAAFYRLSRP